MNDCTLRGQCCRWAENIIVIHLPRFINRMEIKYLSKDGEKISKTCDLEFGKEALALTHKNNLLKNNAAFNRYGFGQFRLTDLKTFSALEKIITEQVVKRLSLYQEVPENFELSKYHQFLWRAENHFKVSTWALDYEILGSSFFDIKKQVEELLRVKLKITRIEHKGAEGEYVGFRILRPKQGDHNPFHRDSWIPYWRNTVNVWLPVCGFEKGNGLQLIPKSHLWNDSEILKTKGGAEIDGKKYSVPAAIGTIHKFTVLKPVMKKGEGLVFSPYLIHGNGLNQKHDITRVSLEFRFCKA